MQREGSIIIRESQEPNIPKSSHTWGSTPAETKMYSTSSFLKTVLKGYHLMKVSDYLEKMHKMREGII